MTIAERKQLERCDEISSYSASQLVKQCLTPFGEEDVFTEVIKVR
ncbi:hypothetical protein OnM2_106011 [Erysiphe neolycopersici]|uniref:Uncharacterized protein n=1 Tax=Erysiphe neolycopersici TaxID=212602 RepID=A0A420H780_9PEZI|nr:hypothetical protein OnM2_106011 [Erysiphe neolycopersici]